MPFPPPDVRDLATRAARAQASRQSTAYGLTNRVFNATLPYFGRRTQMPLVYFQPRSPGPRPMIDMRQAPPGMEASSWPRRIAGPSGLVVYPHGADYFFNRPAARQHFADVLTHEFAHTQQPPQIFRRNAPVPQQQLQIEGGADAFAQLVRSFVARKALGARPAMPYSSGYGNMGNQFIDRFGRNRALYGQFGQP